LDKNADVKKATQKLTQLVAANRTGNNNVKELQFTTAYCDSFYSAGIEGMPAERKGNLLISMYFLLLLYLFC
jgi:hypothetical protein